MCRPPPLAAMEQRHERARQQEARSTEIRSYVSQQRTMEAAARHQDKLVAVVAAREQREREAEQAEIAAWHQVGAGGSAHRAGARRCGGGLPAGQPTSPAAPYGHRWVLLPPVPPGLPQHSYLSAPSLPPRAGAGNAGGGAAAPGGGVRSRRRGRGRCLGGQPAPARGAGAAGAQVRTPCPTRVLLFFSLVPSPFWDTDFSRSCSTSHVLNTHFPPSPAALSCAPSRSGCAQQRSTWSARSSRSSAPHWRRASVSTTPPWRRWWQRSRRSRRRARRQRPRSGGVPEPRRAPSSTARCRSAPSCSAWHRCAAGVGRVWARLPCQHSVQRPSVDPTKIVSQHTPTPLPAPPTVLPCLLPAGGV